MTELKFMNSNCRQRKKWKVKIQMKNFMRGMNLERRLMEKNIILSPIQRLVISASLRGRD